MNLTKYYFLKSVVFLSVILCVYSVFPPVPIHAIDTTFALSFSPSSGSIVQSAKTSTSINITGSAISATGQSLPVTLAVSQGLPVGISVSFSPTQCAPACNSIMTVTASQTAPPGTYNIPVVGAALGMTAQANYSITVSALPTFDYSILLSSNNGSVAIGESIDTTLNLFQLSGTSDSVILSATGQPSGVTVKFSPLLCKPPCSALVTITVQSITSGVYPITISATAGSLTRSANYNLTVEPSALANYSMSVYPTSNIIQKMGLVNALVNLTQLSGTSQEVTLTVGNVPLNMTAKLTPSSCKPPCNSVLTITANDKIVPGTYPITILGYVGGTSKSANYNIIVSGSANFNPISSTSYIFTRSLYRGSRGEDVTRLQQFLATDTSIYPEGTVSGYFGALTEKAVQRFQAKHGIVSSGTPSSTGYGFVGARTRAKLNNLQ